MADEVRVDSIMLEIEATSDNASKEIDKLTASLRKLRSATSAGDKLSKLSQSLTNITTGVSGQGLDRLYKLTHILDSLKKASDLNIPSRIPRQITALGDAVKSFNSADVSGLRTVMTELERTKGVPYFGGMANQLKGLSEAARMLQGQDFSGLYRLKPAIMALSTVQTGKTALSGLTRQLKNLAPVIVSINAADIQKFAEQSSALASALYPLTEVPKQSIASVLGQLKKIPDIFRELNTVDIDAFAAKIRQLTDALRPLANEMAKIGSGFAAFPSKLQAVVNAGNKFSGSRRFFSGKFQNIFRTIAHQFDPAILLAKLHIVTSAVNQYSAVVRGWVEESSRYIETLNLFTVSMGKYGKAAYDYAQIVSDAVGIDPVDWMGAQGIFMTLGKGFGVASDRAAIMSQQLTQLSYDLASFTNIPVADAIQKVQSGFAGELEPLRAKGWDLSQAKLQAIATSLGIDKLVSSMTQAEKAELRYYAIMTQVTDVQGDWARTLQSPANQLRVLSAQVKLLSRSLGNIFIPVLTKTLPYVIAVVKALRMLADTIAAMMGFKLPEIKWSDEDSLVSGTEAAEDNLNGAGKAAKKLKSYLMGFDELNVIDPSTGGGGGGRPDGGGGSFDFDLPTYDFLKYYEKGIDASLERIKQKFKSTAWSFELTSAFSKELSKLNTVIEGYDWQSVGHTLAQHLNWAMYGTDGGEVGRFFATAMNGWLGIANGAVTTFNWSLFGETFADMLTGAFTNFKFDVPLSTGLEIIGGLLEALATAITNTDWVVLGRNVGTGLANAIMNFDWATAAGNIIEIVVGIFTASVSLTATLWEGFTTAIWEKIKTGLFTSYETFQDRIAENGGNVITAIKDGATEALTDISAWMDEHVLAPIQNALVGLFGMEGDTAHTFAQYGVGIILGLNSGIVTRMVGISTFLKSKLVTPIITGVTTPFGMSNGASGKPVSNVMVTYGKGIVRGIWYGIKGMWTLLCDYVEIKINTLKFRMKNGFRDVKSTVVKVWGDMFTDIKKKAEEIKTWLFGWADGLIPDINFNVKTPSETHTGSSGGKHGGSSGGFDPWKTPNFRYAATGGMMSKGQMFVAREAGPEMVGRIGSRTAVANNDQIVQAVSEGVYNAVVAAMGNRDEGTPNFEVKVFLDGKQVSESIDKYKATRGQRIMVGGVV